jgi:hypothetical protein
MRSRRCSARTTPRRHPPATMLVWEHSGFSIDASVRITFLDRDVPSYFQSLEHLLRYCARPLTKVHAAGDEWLGRALAI